MRWFVVSTAVALLVGGMISAEPTPQELRSIKPSRITINATDAPLSNVLRAFAEQSGNRPIAVPRDWGDRTVSLKLRDVPYWEALDRLCRQIGCVYEPLPQDGERSGLTLTRVKKVPPSLAYVGPAVFHSVNMWKYRMFVPFRDKGSTQSLACLFAYFWEDRLTVIGTTVVWKSATTPEGGEVKLGYTAPAFPFRQVFRDGTVCPRVGVYMQSWQFPADDSMLGTIEGTLLLSVGWGEDKEISLTDVLSGEERIGVLGDRTLTAVKVPDKDHLEKGRTVTLRVKANTDDGRGPLALPIDHLTGKYGVFLVDPQGNRRRPNHMRRWYIQRDGRQYFDPEKKVKLIFNDLPQLEGEWSAVCVFPEHIDLHALPFRMENVPWP
ncbi:MAG: hypothetical protein AMS16_05945 [Planctomycetes bacterium DG_58]|nr:MAG: hypothetical protein AMS16_05945 [Planctomycetes bacterium DG_58]